VGASPIVLGPGDKKLIEQYRELGKMWGGAEEDGKKIEDRG
jgi:hypothetical protein